jgi:hypothetical protein
MSSAELIAVYLRQRVHARVFVPLVVLMAGAGWLLAPAAGFDVREFSLAALRALAIVVMFRVWDDLEDRAIDLRRHRDRVMVSSGRFAPFAVLMLSLAILGLVLGLLLFVPDAAARDRAGHRRRCRLRMVRARPVENWSPIVGGLVVLAKYPLIAFAVAPALPGVGAATASACRAARALLAHLRLRIRG